MQAASSVVTTEDISKQTSKCLLHLTFNSFRIQTVIRAGGGSILWGILYQPLLTKYTCLFCLLFFILNLYSAIRASQHAHPE